MFRYDQFQDAHCWEREKIPQILYHCYQYSFSYSYITVNVFLEGDGAGS